MPVGVKALLRRRFAGAEPEWTARDWPCTSAIREDPNSLGMLADLRLKWQLIAHRRLSKIRSDGPAHHNRDNRKNHPGSNQRTHL